MNDYNVTFSCDGSMTITANDAEEAERVAVDALEDLQAYGCDSLGVEACSVRVALEFTYTADDEPLACNKVERDPKVVEFV